MSGGGEEPFRPYSQPNPCFPSGYYPPQPPYSLQWLDASASQPPPPPGLPSFDLNNPFGTSTAEFTAHGGMAGESHGYSGYGAPSPYYQMPYHAGGLPMPEPPWHSTSSLSGFQGGPYASLPPNPLPPVPPSYGGYGEGSSHAAHVHLSPVPPSWHPASMGEYRRSFQRQSRQQAPSPVHDVSSNDNSMPDGGDDDLSDGSSIGDNAAIVGSSATVEHDEGNGDSMGSEGEGSSGEGDLSDEDYEELYKDWELFGKDNPVFKGMSEGEGSSGEGDLILPSDDDTSDEDYEELYKGWEDLFGKDNPVFKGMKLAVAAHRTVTKLFKKAILLVMYEYYVLGTHRRVIEESGIEWVERTLRRPTACYNMFRMNAHVFELLHEELVSKYGLKSTSKMSSREALGMFLYMVGSPQPVRQADNRFERSMGPVSCKFNQVLSCVAKLAKDIIAPKDPTFSAVHPKVANHRSAPFFNNAIGALDGTNVKVVVPFEKVGINRKNEKSQNVLAICDFDRRFTFVAVGVPGSAHDWTVLQEAISKYGSEFPHPPPGKFYLVDAGYPNRPGYLSPYKGCKYHQQKWRRGPAPAGEREEFSPKSSCSSSQQTGRFRDENHEQA